MKANLRKSLDQAMRVKKLLRIKFKVLTKMLEEDPDLCDELIVLLAELANQTSFQAAALHATTENIIAEMSIFGDEGPEKELGYRVVEREEEDEDRNNGYHHPDEDDDEDDHFIRGED